MDFANPVNSILLPPGNKTILRYPAPMVPEGWRKGTSDELFTACLGYPFPWGRLAHATKAPLCWSKFREGAQDQKQRMGIGGLFHREWFKTADGRRYGGASSVPDTFPGSLRCNLRFGGGECPSESPEEIENWTVVKEFCGFCLEANLRMYHAVQTQALQHVTPDGGEIIVSPIGEDNLVHVGFVGRCLWCPNAETISFPQLLSSLRKSLSAYNFELFPEWRDWQV